MGESIGTVHNSMTVFMHIEVGTAKDKDVEYELTHGMRHEPIVRSLKTGNYFTISWEDILRLAIKAGINEEDKQEVTNG